MWWEMQGFEIQQSEGGTALFSGPAAEVNHIVPPGKQFQWMLIMCCVRWNKLWTQQFNGACSNVSMGTHPLNW